jgi:predicted metal-dependent enzyme (double-stranded beta helix superfamily)
MLKCVERFVHDVRALCASSLSPDDRWTAASASMRTLLADPQLRDHARSWPTSPALLGLQGKHANLIFYEDPDYGFVLNGLIKPPGARTTVHDHGRSFTVYGVITGAEKVVRYDLRNAEPVADASEQGLLARADVVLTEESDVGPGHIDYIRPWEVHAEVNGPASTAALILRSQRSGTFVQNIFDTTSGAVEQYHGPRQIPYALG